jgi:DNA-binding SARP family transcriptional activator
MARTNQPPPAGRPRLDFHLLGPVGLWADGRRVDLEPAESAKVRCLLAVLVRTPGTPAPVDALVDRVWVNNPSARPCATSTSAGCARPWPPTA